MADQTTFGTRFLSAATAHERLQLEQDEQRRSPFADVDEAINQIIASAISGIRVATVAEVGTPDRLLPTLDVGEHADAFAHHFGAQSHEQRGGWHLPGADHLCLGAIHMTHWITTANRVALTLADADSARVPLRSDPWAVALWSLVPLFNELNLPLTLRSGNWLGTRTEEQQIKAWHQIDSLYTALDIDPRPVAAFRPDTGWNTLNTDAILSRRRQLADSWQQVSDTAANRFRVHRIGGLVERYYSKARNGVALRRSVLNKDLERILTLYFGGDWLAFLEYIGEPPHPKEELVSELPETLLIAPDSARAAIVAAEHGVASEEVDRILGSLWQEPASSSPIERRIGVMREYWRDFDRLHTEQRSGMRSLRGLVPDTPWYRYPEYVGQPSPSDLSQRLLPEIDQRIAELWGTAMIARWPGRLVTEPAHHLRMCEAFGAALSFWQLVANAAWELCEGLPDDRNPPVVALGWLESRTKGEREELQDIGCPIDTQLFWDIGLLQAGEGRPRFAEDGSRTISLRVTADGVAKSEQPADDEAKHVSFEQLCDVISAHRKRWADEYLDRYLRSRWEPALRAAAREYHIHAANKTTAPTPKQFAPKAEAVANRWFGGDLTGVYTAIGLRAPARPSTRAPRRVPPFPDSVSMPLFERIRDSPFTRRPSMRADAPERVLDERCAYLVRTWLRVLQSWEAVGEQPSVTAIGRSTFEPLADLLADDAEEAWRRFCHAIDTVADAAWRHPLPH